MTEYWVSKKQYWCKYCSIWIRDDAPSRKQHETGLKHQGSKERYIRELYKSGNQAKRDKATEAAEMARINAAAEAAHAHDTHLPTSRPSLLSSLQSSAAASSSKVRDSKPTDKWANYSSAKDLGFDDEDTQKSAYEIEQEIKGRAAPIPGAWEEVVDTQPISGWEGDAGGKRKLGQYGVEDDAEEAENFRFEHRRKPVRDPYDDDDWDPKKALGRLKLKAKEKGQNGSVVKHEVKEEEEPPQGGLDREAWTGKLELRADGSERKGKEKTRDGLVYVEGGGWVKAPEDEEEEPGEKPKTAMNGKEASGTHAGPSLLPTEASDEVKPQIQSVENDTKPALSAATEPAAEAESTASSLFKKRRPPPGNRKK